MATVFLLLSTVVAWVSSRCAAVETATTTITNSDDVALLQPPLRRPTWNLDFSRDVVWPGRSRRRLQAFDWAGCGGKCECLLPTLEKHDPLLPKLEKMSVDETQKTWKNELCPYVDIYSCALEKCGSHKELADMAGLPCGCDCPEFLAFNYNKGLWEQEPEKAQKAICPRLFELISCMEGSSACQLLYRHHTRFRAWMRAHFTPNCTMYNAGCKPSELERCLAGCAQCEQCGQDMLAGKALDKSCCDGGKTFIDCLGKKCFAVWQGANMDVDVVGAEVASTTEKMIDASAKECPEVCAIECASGLSKAEMKSAYEAAKSSPGPGDGASDTQTTGAPAAAQCQSTATTSGTVGKSRPAFPKVVAAALLATATLIMG